MFFLFFCHWHCICHYPRFCHCVFVCLQHWQFMQLTQVTCEDSARPVCSAGVEVEGGGWPCCGRLSIFSSLPRLACSWWVSSLKGKQLIFDNSLNCVFWRQWAFLTITRNGFFISFKFEDYFEIGLFASWNFQMLLLSCIPTKAWRGLIGAIDRSTFQYLIEADHWHLMMMMIMANYVVPGS